MPSGSTDECTERTRSRRTFYTKLRLTVSLRTAVGLGEALSQPVRHQRPVLIRAVVADVGTVRVHHERRVGCLASDPFRVRWGKEAVPSAVDDEQRLGQFVEDALEVQ